MEGGAEAGGIPGRGRAPLGPQGMLGEARLGTEAPCPLLSCSLHPPVSLPGFPGWSPEPIIRGPGGERIQRARQSVSGGGRATEGVWEAPGFLWG